MGIPESLDYGNQGKHLARRMVAVTCDVSRIIDIRNINKLEVNY